MSIYKSNTMQIPIYDDGYFYLYKIRQDGIFPVDHIKKYIDKKFYFNYQSVGYKLKYDLLDRNINVETKIVIPLCKIIDALYVVKIDNVFYHVANAYHGKNKNGFDETTLTLERYKKYIVEGE